MNLGDIEGKYIHSKDIEIPEHSHEIYIKKYKCKIHGIHDDYIYFTGNINHPLINMKLCWICIYEFLEPIIGNMELINEVP